MHWQESMIMKVLKNPWKLVKHIGGKGHLKWIPDKLYLQICYRAAIGNKLNLKNPKGFNEKLQWLKLYDHNPLYTTMVDKVAVKDYVANVIGKEYIIPTLGVWNKFEEIDFESLPNRFVLKCTHDSGGVIICDDKATFDYMSAKKKINKSLNRQFFYVGREWPYKRVQPRIIAETYIMNDMTDDLIDYKLMCFNGKVKCSFVCTNRHSKEGIRVTFYNLSWEMMPFERHYPKDEQAIEKPQSYDQMIQLAEQLAVGLPFVRVDFYEVGEVPFFGEITLYPGNGFEEFTPEKYDKLLGSWIQLPAISN